MSNRAPSRPLTTAAHEKPSSAADDLAAAIAADLNAFACGTPFEDDRTLVIARRLA